MLWRELGLGILFTLLPRMLLPNLCWASDPIDYQREIHPLLEHKCVPCHGRLQQQAGLRLDAGSLIHLGGDSGPAALPGEAADSLLIERVSTDDADLRMPPSGEGEPLNDQQIELLRLWIAQGAAYPDEEVIPQDPADYWSYQPVVKPALPKVEDPKWVRNPIDQFIAAEHDAHGLKPRPEAAPEVWLRRVYLDLIGIPPTRDELRTFLNDGSADAHERVVDALLHRPEYGQRWGRHWMDVWRYSDWYGSRGGNEIRYSQRNIWRWRDWIVNSLIDDKPYDYMVLEMLAGDELSPLEPDALAATGYLGRNWYKFDRNVWLFDTVEHTSQAFLALTLRCARCHDHKYDPIQQEEYYRFRAFFEPHDVRTDPVSAEAPMENDATLGMVLSDGVARVFDKTLDADTYLFRRGDDRLPDRTSPLEPAVPAALGNTAFRIEPIALPVAAYYPSLQEPLIAARIAKAEAAVVHAQQQLKDKRLEASHILAKLECLQDGEANTPPTPEPRPLLSDDFSKRHSRISRLPTTSATVQREYKTALKAVEAAEGELGIALAERLSLQTRLAAERAKYLAPPAKSAQEVDSLASEASRAEQAVVVARARHALANEPEASKQAVLQRALEKAEAAMANPDTTYTPLGDIYPTASTGRRLALARWIIDPQNPRTARVAVNHIWLRHFGEAIVPSVANFGLNGQYPSHAQLLDWLAAEFIENHWQMKPLHRMVVLSATYRQSSAIGTESESFERDPDNRYLWRMNSRRMEAEVVRDAILATSGLLDQEFGGPELAESEGQTSFRRSLYFRNTPNEKMLFLETFDGPNPNECYRRQESVVPHQALGLLNSQLAIEQSRRLANRLSELCGGPEDLESGQRFIEAAWETILSRRPSADEVAACRDFLERNTATVRATDTGNFPAGPGTASLPAADTPEQRARENLVHVLYSHNDFVTIR